MNNYVFDSSVVTTTTTPNVPEQVTLSGVVALSDQLQSAVQDCLDAWAGFVTGPLPAGQRPDMPKTADRLEDIHNDMHASVRKLAELARLIRDRS